MTNSFKRGSAPGRGRPEQDRSGSFKPGHEKRGGRKRGTPNAFSADYKRALVEAAYRVGIDGNGRDGVPGYFQWMAECHPQAYCGILINILPLELVEGSAPEDQQATREDIDQRIRDYIGLPRKQRSERRPIRSNGRSGWDWTGQPFPVNTLMQLAVEDPKEFATLVNAAFFRPPTKAQRAAAARRSLERPSKKASSKEARVANG